MPTDPTMTTGRNGSENLSTCRNTMKRKARASTSVVRSLFRRQALGRKGRLPATHGLPTAPASLVYSMAETIPPGERHDRILLGFTADGEHVVVCCGPLASPSWLELRRVRLQWPGLSRPGEALWVLPLDPRVGAHARQSWRSSGGGDGGWGQPSDDTAWEGDGEMGEEEEDEDEPGAGGGAWGMGMSDREPASVAVTESADGFLVVAVVALRCAPEMQGDEEWVYRVFVAPGPSYVAAAHASSEFPFMGEAFSYIVPAGAATPFPSLAALDVGCVGGIEKRRGPEGAERAYMIVLNAVDTIRVLEVRLHTEGEQRSPGKDLPLESNPPPPGTKFTIRPPGTPAAATAGTAADHLPVWWAVGRDLPSTPLISTRPLPCRPPVAGTGAAAPPRRTTATARSSRPHSASAATAGGETEVAPRSLGSVNDGGDGPESQGVAQEERGQGAGITPAGARDIPRRRRRPARASIDRSRQRVLDLEVFISQLLRKPEAFAGDREVGRGAEELSGNGGGGDEAGSSGGLRRGSAPSVTVGEGGRPLRPSALATDYHCVTVGLFDGGRRLLLCLVIEVVYTNSSGGAGERGRTGAGLGGVDREAGLLGYVLALDLGSGEVAVMGRRSSRGSGIPCAASCYSLARNVRRLGGYPLARPGRRLTNAAVLQGRPLAAIVNPVFPVAIVRGDG